jgi:Flp pilus assembly pilin Flp
MARLYLRLHGSVQEKRGATVVEYGLIATLVAVVTIGGLSVLDGDLMAALHNLARAIASGL